MENEIPANPKRSSHDYRGMSRWQILNHFRTEYKKARPGHKLKDFLAKFVWSWLYHTVKSRFGPKHKYLVYTDGATGIYQLQEDASNDGKYTSVALVADWATDTAESIQIAERMRSHDPDYTIHLGDTYFVGSPPEIKSNFLDPGAPWVRGKAGSFSVLGNHEMYARGVAFFDDLLPSLGRRMDSGEYEGQKAGFFCLQNDYWRILGLDTGYHSIGIPLIEFLPFCKPTCEFDQALLDWLQNTVKLGDPTDKRALLILTHHQFITAFKEDEYARPATQLAKLVGRKKSVLWIWGHEHKLSFYQKASVKDGFDVHGRCIGHGGAPVELNGSTFQISPKKNGSDKLLAYDKRKEKEVDRTPLGFNGYVLVKIRGQELQVSYHDSNQCLLSETWIADIESETMTGHAVPPDQSLLPPEAGKNWDQLCAS